MDDPHGDGDGSDRLEKHDEYSSVRVFMEVRSLVGLSFLGTVSYGLLAPVLPILMTEYYAREATEDAVIDCNATPQPQSCVDGSKRAAWISSIFSAIGSVLLILLSPVIGHASDMFGRKVFLLVDRVLNVGVPVTAIYFVQPSGSIIPYFILTLVTSLSPLHV